MHCLPFHLGKNIFKRTVGDRRNVSFEFQVFDVLVSLAKSLVFKREKPNQFLSHYWFRAPFAVGGATGDASTKDRDPTTAFGFRYRLQIIPKVYGAPWVAGVYFCQLSRSLAVSRGLLACLGRCLFGCYKYR